MAFRAHLRDWILPIPGHHYVHDEWIALLASTAGAEGVFIETPLIHYRQHPQQVIGVRKQALVDQVSAAYNVGVAWYASEPSKYLLVLKRLDSAGKLTRETEQLLERKMMHLKTRQLIYSRSYSHWKHCGWALRELIFGRYHQFSNAWRSIAKDLFLAKKN